MTEQEIGDAPSAVQVSGTRVTMTRPMATFGAVLACTGLGVQLYILMTGPMGSIAGIWRYLAFFTVLTNILAAVVFIAAIVKPCFSPANARARTAVTVYMAFLGLVYSFILQPLWNPQGLRLIADILLHYATPTMTILFWIVCVPKSALRWSDILRWTAYPLAYLVYALTRAQFDGFYPYHFIDAGQLGLGGVLWNAATMLAAFVVLGAIFVAIGKIMARGWTGSGPDQSTSPASSSQ